MITPSDGIYNHAWFYPRGQSLIFGIRSCQHAFLLLSTDVNHVQNSYEFELGSRSNEAVTLRRNADVVEEVDAYRVLVCDVTQWFSVEWRDGDIQLKKGSGGGSDVILSWTDHNPHAIYAISMKLATGENKPAEWLIDEDQGMFNYYFLCGT